MSMPEVTQKTVDALQAYAKTVYLSQTCQKKDGKTTWFLNLEDAFEDFQKDPGPREWRTHFHVPVFLDDLGRVPHDALRAGAGAGVPQEDAALDAPRDRDLHLGRAARPPEDRRHRRVRHPRDRLGQEPGRLTS